MTRTLNKPLLDLTAGDLMSQALVLVPAHMSLAGAARLLSRARVTGAPVINADGRCVGVLSATDFMQWAGHGRPQHSAGEAFCASWQIHEPEALPNDPVSQHMTADPVTVAPTTPVGRLAQMMLDAHIHRLIVLDKNQSPVGIVSATDILGALARFHQEPWRGSEKSQAELASTR